jgi:hypothetical protein
MSPPGYKHRITVREPGRKINPNSNKREPIRGFAFLGRILSVIYFLKEKAGQCYNTPGHDPHDRSV